MTTAVPTLIDGVTGSPLRRCLTDKFGICKAWNALPPGLNAPGSHLPDAGACVFTDAELHTLRAGDAYYGKWDTKHVRESGDMTSVHCGHDGPPACSTYFHLKLIRDCLWYLAQSAEDADHA